MNVCFESDTPDYVCRAVIQRNHNRKWPVCPTWHFLSDALAYFSTGVVMKVKRAESGRKQLSERKPGHLFFEVHCHSGEELGQALKDEGARGCDLCRTCCAYSC